MALPSWIHNPPENSVDDEIRRLPPDTFMKRGTTIQGDRNVELERLRRLSDLGYLA